MYSSEYLWLNYIAHPISNSPISHSQVANYLVLPCLSTPLPNFLPLPTDLNVGTLLAHWGSLKTARLWCAMKRLWPWVRRLSSKLPIRTNRLSTRADASSCPALWTHIRTSFGRGIAPTNSRGRWQARPISISSRQEAGLFQRSVQRVLHPSKRSSRRLARASCVCSRMAPPLSKQKQDTDCKPQLNFACSKPYLCLMMKPRST